MRAIFWNSPRQCRLRALVLVALAIGVIVSPRLSADEPAPAPAPSVPKPVSSASELVHALEKALAGIGKAKEEQSGDATFKTPRAAAFSLALSQAAGQAAQLMDAISGGNKGSFQAMRRLGASVAALQVTYRYSGIDSDDIDVDFRTLVAIYQILRRNYGRDLAAAKTESESALTPPQKTALLAIKDLDATLAKQLAELQPRIKDNPAIAFEFNVFTRETARIDKAQLDRRSLLDALTLAEIVAGRWNGLSFYTEKVYPSEAEDLAPLIPLFRDYEAALKTACDAAYDDSGPATFSQPAVYAEDISVDDVSEKEIAPLIDQLSHAADTEAAPPSSEKQKAADVAEDRQINKDDPDDDSSLDSSEEEENGKPADEGSLPGLPKTS